MATGVTESAVITEPLPKEVPSPGPSRSITVTRQPSRSSDSPQATPTIPAPTTMAWRPFPAVSDMTPV